MMRRPATLAACLLLAAGPLAPEASAEPVAVAGGYHLPFFAEEGATPTTVPDLRMDAWPVTNADFARFTRRHPRWAPGAPPALFADVNYLKHWRGLAPGDLRPGTPSGDQPVTWISWFAAAAYCEDAGGRLPTEAEWELAATPSTPDDHDAVTQRILRWYAQPGTTPLPTVHQHPPDARGLYDLHGVVWEWVADFNASMIVAARRNANERVLGLFCGGASVAAKNPKDYATFLRYAMRSSLSGHYTTRNLGFRCAYPES